MAKQVQLRRGTTAQHAGFTGAVAEITVDTDLNTIRVHDGSTAGGHRLLNYADLSGISSNIVPTANAVYDLGSVNNYWRDLYLSGNSLFLGNIVMRDESGTVTFTNTISQTSISVAGGGGGALSRYIYLAANNQSVFSGADINNQILYMLDPSLALVYLNGALLTNNLDYTAYTTNVTIAEGLQANDVVSVLVGGTVDSQTTLVSSKRYTYNTQSLTTVITGADLNNQTLNLTYPEKVHVFVNGILMMPDTDYTAYASNITFTSSILTGSTVIILDNLSQVTSNVVTSLNGSKGDVTVNTSNIAEGANLYFTDTRSRTAVQNGVLANLTISGNLVVDSNVLYIDTVSKRVGVGTTAPTRLFTVQNDNPSGSATLGVRNQSSGTGAYATITTEALGTTGYFYTFGSGYTSSGQYLANSSLIEINGTNGLGISAVSADANASIRFYTNSGTERAAITSTGNLNYDSGTFFIDAAGNRVGIGTTSPSVTLDVRGNVSINPNTASVPAGWTGSYDGLTIISNKTAAIGDGRVGETTALLLMGVGSDVGNNSEVSIDFAVVDSNSVLGNIPQVRIGYSGATNPLINTSPDNEAEGYFRIATRTATAAGILVDRYVVDGNGNTNIGSGSLYINAVNNRVGIGTNNPSGVLDAGGNTLSTQVYFRNNGTYSGGSGGQTALNVVFGGMNIAKIANTGTGQRDGTFHLLDENTIKVSISANASRGGDSYINNGGNFGIGTNSPSAKLDVAGNVTTSGNFQVAGTTVINSSRQATFTHAQASGAKYRSDLAWYYAGSTTDYDGTYYAPWILFFEYTNDAYSLFVDIDIHVCADPNYAYFSAHKINISRHANIGTEIRGIAVRHIGGRDNYLAVFNTGRKIYIKANALWGDGIFYRINTWADSGSGALLPCTTIGRDTGIAGYNGSNVLNGQGLIYNGVPTDYPSSLLP